jgi:hypothetical protein
METPMIAKNVSKGMVAGFVATIVLSALMMMKQTMGVMPQLNPVQMLTDMMGASTPLVGWAAHFMIGTLAWGGLFSLLNSRLPGESYWIRGSVFGFGAWLMMMIVVMPMAGAGLFGMQLSIMAPVMTLVLHLIFGAVLGGVYGAERPELVPTIETARR